MTSIVVTQKVAFQKPSTGPRDYISTSAAGWPERFPKAIADDALKAFVGDTPIAELVANFQEFLDLKRQGIANWTDVIGYLGRVFGVQADDIEYKIGIAFWARMIVNEKEGKKC